MAVFSNSMSSFINNNCTTPFIYVIRKRILIKCTLKQEMLMKMFLKKSMKTIKNFRFKLL